MVEMREAVSGMPEKFEQLVQGTLKEHWQLFVVQGVLLSLLGLAAIALPGIATLAADILIGWILFAAGLFKLLTLLRAPRAAGYWPSIALAVLMIVLGIVLAVRPIQGVITLTLALAAFFIANGITSLVVAFTVRSETSNWVLILLGGVVDFILAYLILSGWPGTATWVLGLLLGINLLFTGVSLVFAALDARRQSAT